MRSGAGCPYSAGGLGLAHAGTTEETPTVLDYYGPTLLRRYWATTGTNKLLVLPDCFGWLSWSVAGASEVDEMASVFLEGEGGAFCSVNGLFARRTGAFLCGGGRC